MHVDYGKRFSYEQIRGLQLTDGARIRSLPVNNNRDLPVRLIDSPV